MSDFLRNLPGAVAPIFRDSGRAAPPERVEFIKSAADLHARRREEERQAALRAEAEAGAQQDIALEEVPPPSPTAAPSSRQQDVPNVKREPEPPALSYEQHSAQRAVFRHACNWLQLHHLCGNPHCRRAKNCRGNPMNCMRAAVPHVPESARQFVRGMIEGKELDLDFEEAFEDAEEFQESWAGWIAGLQAAAKAGNKAGKPRQKGPK